MTALSWHSLKLRLPLLTVLLFLGGLWTLALFAHYKLRQDMRSQVEAQQQSTAMFAALALEHTLQERQAILLRVARSLSFTVERSAKTLVGSAMSGEGLVNVYRGTGKILMAPVS